MFKRFNSKQISKHNLDMKLIQSVFPLIAFVLFKFETFKNKYSVEYLKLYMFVLLFCVFCAMSQRYSAFEHIFKSYQNTMKNWK